MKITSLVLKNFRGIENVEMPFSGNLNVLVGLNGSGKSTILDAIAIALSWPVKRIVKDGARGNSILDSSIKNNTPYASIFLKANSNNKQYKWYLVKGYKGVTIEEQTEMFDASRLATQCRVNLINTNSLPVVAYYGINRLVGGVLSKIPNGDNFNPINIYEDCLDAKTNYQTFFEWFRIQDDIANEDALSQSNWMKNNKNWIDDKLDQILRYLKNIHTNINDLNLFDRSNFVIEYPRYIFHTFKDILINLKNENLIESEFVDVFDEVIFISSTLTVFPNIDDERIKRELAIVEYSLKKIHAIIKNIKYDVNMITFIWNSFALALVLNFWWFSDNSKNILFDILFTLCSNEYLSDIKYFDINEFKYSLSNSILWENRNNEQTNFNNFKVIEYISKTIKQFLPEYTNLKVKRLPQPHMEVDKNGETVSLNQLSDGEKNFIALIGDIARRLIIANPKMENPMDGEGIILIDEIDLHLHPSWQRLVIPKLTTVFPNIQFFITTHSPQVISHVQPENIYLLNSENGIFTYSKALESFGKNSDRILEDIFGVDARPHEQKLMLQQLFESIQKGNLELAKQQVNELNEMIGNDSELVKARILIKRKELIGK